MNTTANCKSSILFKIEEGDSHVIARVSSMLVR